MNRREFTASLAAMAAAPAIPAAATAHSAAPTAAKYFTNAKLIAQAHNSCSPEMLSRLMRLDMGTAQSLQSMLFEKGVITHANGLAMATNPMNTNCIPVEALKPTNLAQSVLDVREEVSNLADRAKDFVQNDPENVQNTARCGNEQAQDVNQTPSDLPENSLNLPEQT